MVDNDLQILVKKYSNENYKNMFDLIYDNPGRTRHFNELCYNVHGFNQQQVQNILQEFANDELIYSPFAIDIAPDITNLGYNVYYQMKIQRNGELFLKT
jgi:hypothetical protein